jgi:hypothetical protein
VWQHGRQHVVRTGRQQRTRQQRWQASAESEATKKVAMVANTIAVNRFIFCSPKFLLKVLKINMMGRIVYLQKVGVSSSLRGLESMRVN